MWATGRRHVKISKLYLRALVRRGPNIFVALAWSQVFWLVLEIAAGNEDSHGYVRLSSVACYAFGMHVGSHLILFHCHRRRLGHHTLEFLLDLVTDVVGFAWINVAEEMLAQVFGVTAKTAFVYAALACAASVGAMEVGSCFRSLLDWPQEFDESANQFDAGSFALPTSWLVTQAVHIALYGFFYRTSAFAGQESNAMNSGDQEVDVRLAASLFLLVYALLCSTVAARLIGGTVAAATVGTGAGGHSDGGGTGTVNGDRSDFVLRAVEAGGPFTAALASDVVPPSTHGVGKHKESLEHEDKSAPRARRNHLAPDEDGSSTGLLLDEGGRGRLPSMPAATALLEVVVGTANAGRARRESVRRGLKAYMRLTVGMMVGWAYNLWGQVEFRQEELEFRFGPALGAAVYATLSTALGVCIMVRGADRLEGGEGGQSATVGRDLSGQSLGYGNREQDEPTAPVAEKQRRYMGAVEDFHARRMLVVVGGVSLMVGWAWEEAFDLMAEACVGDSADAGMVVAKLVVAMVATAAVLAREIRTAAHHDGGCHDDKEGHGTGNGNALGRGGGDELSEPLISSTDR